MRAEYLPKFLVCSCLAANFIHIQYEFGWYDFERFLQLGDGNSGNLLRHFHSKILVGI
jgi:hypothetical protein